MQVDFRWRHEAWELVLFFWRFNRRKGARKQKRGKRRKEYYPVSTLSSLLVEDGAFTGVCVRTCPDCCSFFCIICGCKYVPLKISFFLLFLSSFSSLFFSLSHLPFFVVLPFCCAVRAQWDLQYLRCVNKCNRVWWNSLFPHNSRGSYWIYV